MNHLRPETFPKVEDNADMLLSYKNGVGIFEGSWDLPRSYQDLEVFGLKGSVYMKNGKVELRNGRESRTRSQLAAAARALRADRLHGRARSSPNKPIEGLTALDINVGVVEIIEAAKKSVKPGNAMPLPLKA